MGAGRKKSYDPNTFPLLAEQYARNGLSDKQIANNLCISHATYYQYIIDYPEFSDAIKRGKKPVDIEVENALLKRALGFDFEEKSTEMEIDKEGKASVKSIRTTKKHIPADVGAMAFWLKNRKPKEWRDQQTIEVTGNPFEELMKFATATDNGETGK